MSPALATKRALLALGVTFAMTGAAAAWVWYGQDWLQSRRAAAGAPIVLPPAEAPGGGRLMRFASQAYHVDRGYESMRGPQSEQHGLDAAGVAGSDQVIWLRGITTKVVDADTLAAGDQDLFCHSNLELDRPGAASARAREAMFGVPSDAMDARLFTLVPGCLSMRLPEGFALPVMPGERLFYQSMVLNLNRPQIDERVRIQTEVEILPPDAAEGIKPLYRRALYALQPVDPSSPVAATPEEADKCGCGPGMAVAASSSSFLPRFGRDQTLHWYVPPGEQTYYQDVTGQLALQADTRIHHAAVHLHPHGRWVELRDVTAGETVLRLEARDHEGRRGVAHVDQLSSVEGLLLRAGHSYELVTFYDNTTQRPVDAMSILYLYMARPAPDAAPRTASARGAN